jgi:hypothetical protein
MWRRGDGLISAPQLQQEITPMRVLALAITALAALTMSALAADLPTKAPAAPPAAFSTNGSGWYVGLNTEASIAPSSVTGTTFPSLDVSGFTVAGGAVGVDAGYIWSNCLAGTWCQFEVDADWQNISGGTVGASAQSLWNVSEEFDVGVQVFQNAIAALPSLNGNNPFPIFNPTSLIPAGLAVASTPQQYIGAVAEQFQLSGSFGAATGEDWAVAWGLDTGYRWQTLNASGKPNGGSLNIQARVLWPSRGITLNNVFAAGGAPVTIGAAVEESTLYTLKLQYDFALPNR